MKYFTWFLSMTLLMTAAFAAPIPRGSFPAGEYEAAKAEAKETGKPIAIVTTELKSSCPKCMAGNEEVFKQMKKDYVLVIDDSKSQGKLPEQVKQRTFPIYKSKGNTIPIVAVLSPTNEQLVGGLCYKQISASGKKAFTTLKTEVDAGLAQAAAQPAPAAPGEKAPAPQKTENAGGMREWINSDGKTIKAEAIACNATSVTFKLENGKVVDYPLDKLSDKSRELAEELFDTD
jgi:hypothetical protein